MQFPRERTANLGSQQNFPEQAQPALLVLLWMALGEIWTTPKDFQCPEQLTTPAKYPNKLNNWNVLHASKWSVSRTKTCTLSWQQLTNFLFPKYFDNIPAVQNHRSLFVILRQDYQSNKDTTGVNSKAFSPHYVMLTQQAKFIFKCMG